LANPLSPVSTMMVTGSCWGSENPWQVVELYRHCE
jgi:hypothetical protein